MFEEDNEDEEIPVQATSETQPSDKEMRPIAERKREGIEVGNHHDGRIVPFATGLAGNNILEALTGDELKKHQGRRWHGYLPTVFEYRDEEGDLLQVVVRYDHATERKIIVPLRYCGKGRDGRDLFYWTWIPGTKLLYGADLLAQRAHAPVLVVEGEKAANAARLLLPNYVVIAWPSGSAGLRLAELLPLVGREITCWPDNDPAGRRMMRIFAALAVQAGAKSVAIVDVPPELGKGWDLADTIPAELVSEVSIPDLLASARPVDAAFAAMTLRDDTGRFEQQRVLGHEPGYSKVDQEAVADALQILDADMEGRRWIAVGRSLFYAYGENGLTLFEDWSRGGEKHKDGEAAAIWRKFGTDRQFRGAPLAWIFRMALAEARKQRRNVNVDAAAVIQSHVEELNESHAVVTRGSKTVVAWERYDPLFDRLTIDYLDEKAFTQRHKRKVRLPAEGGKQGKLVPIGKLWFESGWRRQYEGAHFAPGKNIGRDNINLWRGFAVQAVGDPSGWQLFKNHILENIAGSNAVAYTYILDWMATSVQHLDRPVSTALVFQGPKGAGKSIFTMLFGHLFGEHAFSTSIPEDIFGRFNAHLETTLLLGVEEAFAPTNRSADGTLKDIVNRNTLRVEPKFAGVVLRPNHLRIIMTSNSDHVVRADGNERRFAVFDVNNKHISDPKKRRVYFGALIDQMEAGGYEAMLAELLARDVSRWNPELLPDTDAFKRQKQLSLSADLPQAWYYSRLVEGNRIVSGDTGDRIEWSETEMVWVPVADVLADYAAFAQRHGASADDQRLKQKLARYMRPDFSAKNKRAATRVGTPVMKHYPFPPLAEARQLFTKATGLEFDADADADAKDGAPDGDANGGVDANVDGRADDAGGTGGGSSVA